MQTDTLLAGGRDPFSATLRLATDAHLVEQVHAGSERAFEALFERYHTALLQFCMRFLGPTISLSREVRTAQARTSDHDGRRRARPTADDDQATRTRSG